MGDKEIFFIIVGIIILAVIVIPYIKNMETYSIMYPGKYNWVQTSLIGYDDVSKTYRLVWGSQGFSKSSDCSEDPFLDYTFSVDTFQGDEDYGDKLVKLPDYDATLGTSATTNYVDFTGIGAVVQPCSSDERGVNIVFDVKEASCNRKEESQGDYHKTRLICQIHYKAHAVNESGATVPAHFYGMTGGTIDNIKFYKPGTDYTFRITGQNTGNVAITNIQIVNATPLEFKNSIPSSLQSLNVGESKTLWTSNPIPIIPPTTLWIKLSGYNTYTKQTIYEEASLAITSGGYIITSGDYFGIQAVAVEPKSNQTIFIIIGIIFVIVLILLDKNGRT